MKVRTYDSNQKVDILAMKPISKANAIQRAGRAGRIAPGKCFRLYTKLNYDELKEYTEPEILRTELTGSILQLKAIGVEKVKELELLDKPPLEDIESALETLSELKCIHLYAR